MKKKKFVDYSEYIEWTKFSSPLVTPMDENEFYLSGIYRITKAEKTNLMSLEIFSDSIYFGLLGLILIGLSYVINFLHNNLFCIFPSFLCFALDIFSKIISFIGFFSIISSPVPLIDLIVIAIFEEVDTSPRAQKGRKEYNIAYEKYRLVRRLKLIGEEQKQEKETELKLEKERIEDEIKRVKAEKEQSLKFRICPRCGGSGYIPRFSHIASGRCFRCNRRGL